MLLQHNLPHTQSKAKPLNHESHIKLIDPPQTIFDEDHFCCKEHIAQFKPKNA
jgi:hypothetical protein